MSTLVSVSAARCRIGRSLLCIDDFSIQTGEHWCVFGPNGAGKTLLANLLAGQRLESGKYVRYALGFDPVRDCLSVSFEEQQRLWQRDNRLDISDYSADAIDQGTRVKQLITGSRSPAAPDETLLAELIRQLDLQALLDKGIRFLSSGQVRRALLARALYGALAGDKRLLLLDDPLESIDAQSRQRIEHCISGHVGGGFASLHLCRRAADIPSWVTHLALMRDLALVEQGPAEAVRASAAFARLADPIPSLPEILPLDNAGTHNDHQPLLELRNVQAAYGEQRVLSAINWVMEAGDHVLIEGPNGCGKSTLLSLIDGDNHKAYGQEVILFGQRKGSGETVWDIKARFGIVSNELHNKYVKGWRVLDVVVSGFFDSVGLYDDSGGRQQEQARRWLDALELAELARSYYQELSFGQQRLVLLARAMVKQPRILVLDEPCVGLDDYHRRLILGIVDLIAEAGTTQIIYVSHVTGEQPACINRRFGFQPVAAGGYTLKPL